MSRYTTVPDICEHCGNDFPWKSKTSITTPTIPKPDPIATLDLISSRFHLISRQIRQRHGSRASIVINDEYDVQDLTQALMCLFFNDIRSEEWNPSYAGSSSRSDFLLKQEGIVVEIKKTRNGLNSKELGEQLIIDKAKYKGHPDCKVLYCFVYDPDERILNPRGLEVDLEEVSESFRVIVKIVP